MSLNGVCVLQAEEVGRTEVRDVVKRQIRSWHVLIIGITFQASMVLVGLYFNSLCLADYWSCDSSAVATLTILGFCLLGTIQADIALAVMGGKHWKEYAALLVLTWSISTAIIFLASLQGFSFNA